MRRRYVAALDAIRHRPLVVAAGAFAAGVSLGSHAWAPLLLLGLAAACAALFVAPAPHRQLTNQRRRTAAFAALFLSVAASGALRQLVQTMPGPHDVSRRIGAGFVRVTGTLASDAEVDREARFILAAGTVQQADWPAQACTGRVQCSVALGQDRRVPRYGDTVTVAGTLLPPGSARNPGAAAGGEYLKRHGVFATMRAPYPSLWRRHANHPGSGLIRWSLAWRDSMSAAFGQRLPAHTTALLTGIVLGGRHYLPHSVEDAFVRSGLAHILAASGANVAIFLWVIMWTTRRSHLDARLRAVLCCAATVFYTLAAGPQPSVVRAAIMAVAVVAAPVLDRDTDAPSALALAALCTLVWDPGSMFDTGFQLSFVIVAFALAWLPIWTSALDARLPAIPTSPRFRGVGSDGRRPICAHVANRFARASVGTLALSATAGLAAAPITAEAFNAVPTVGIVANALAAPGLALLLPGALIAWIACLIAPPVGHALCVGVVGPLADYIAWVATTTGGWRGAVVHTPSPGWPIIWLWYGVMAAIAFRHPGSARR